MTGVGALIWICISIWRRRCLVMEMKALTMGDEPEDDNEVPALALFLYEPEDECTRPSQIDYPTGESMLSSNVLFPPTRERLQDQQRENQWVKVEFINARGRGRGPAAVPAIAGASLFSSKRRGAEVLAWSWSESYLWVCRPWFSCLIFMIRNAGSTSHCLDSSVWDVHVGQWAHVSALGARDQEKC